VLSSIFDRFRNEFEAHLRGNAPAAEPVFVAELLDVRDGVAVIDEHHRHKQPDWSFGATSSGATPADLKSRYRKDHPVAA
jgi:hypothetical protein